MPAPSAKARNRAMIARHLYTHRTATTQELMQSLGLSAPTVTQNLRELIADGTVSPGGLQRSTGGRKARDFVFNPNHHLAIGVASTPTTVTLRAINLYGDTVADLNRTLPYRDDAAYWQRVDIIVNEFAANAVTSRGRNVAAPAGGNAATVLGIGLCLRTPAVAPFTQTTRHPYVTIHHADASATAEAWFDPTIDDAVCVYLDRQPSGSLIIGGRLHQPTIRTSDEDDAGTIVAHRNGTIEHMTLVPGGRKCTCGRLGCMSAYCSPQTLPEDYESIPGFFSVLEQGETHHRERMDEWLGYVAQAITNARSVVTGDVIVGGEAAQYLDDDDLTELKRRVCMRTEDDDGSFTLRAARADDRLHLTGAALRFTQRYLHDLIGL
ncbi:ROK family transcriptional regulator [Bifidobacterium aerophilum]|uniref:ROK family protein n=1 Tax=Bifidobacterium aerophilum TaxID=1798155 RepID=A0A6N9Z7Q4_9BIFI|nr:ROK family transcriptional regulator [Bifidobacterium aerophilum]NEG90163.1 ROK family protein [Bifidobacterium aerophilum]